MNELKKADLEVAILQLQSVDNWQQNETQILDLLGSVNGLQEVDLVCLPENALYMRLTDTESVPAVDFSLHFEKLKKIARENDLLIHVGSVPVSRGEKLGNCSVHVYPTGEVKTSYQKIHLFDIQLEGQKANRESDVFEAGVAPSIFEWRGFKIAESICYDVRFAELYSQYAKAGVDLILVPSSFLVPTGKAHWEVLLRARAIESQCYVVASAQGGEHSGAKGSRRTFGNSLVVSPWGEVEVCINEVSRPGWARVRLERSRIERVREQIPMKSHRRLN